MTHEWDPCGAQFWLRRWRTWFVCRRRLALALAWGKRASEPTEIRGGGAVTMDECRGRATC